MITKTLSGSKTAAADTATQLVTDVEYIEFVFIQPKATNTVAVFIGGVDGQTARLMPTDQGIMWPINDLSKVYIKTSVENEGVDYTAFTSRD